MNRISKAALTALVFTSLALGGCGGGEKASGEKTVVYATTGYGREMGEIPTRIIPDGVPCAMA